MSKDYLHKFRRKIDIGGCSQGESETTELRDNFNDLVDNKLSPTVHTVKYVARENVGLDLEGIDINVNITDVSDNDQKTNDEKFVNFKYELDVKSGDIFYWYDTWWILYHQERKTIFANKTFTCRRCNFDYCIEIDGIKYHFPIQLMNLTLYSDGMADQTYMSSQDGSRRVTISDNQYSKFVRLGTRIMLSEDTIYEVCHIDDFSRHGVKDCMLKQVFMTSKDDKENLVAWNDFGKPHGEGIIGEDTLILGGTEIYKHPFDDDNSPYWVIIAEDDCVWRDYTYNNSENGYIRIKCTTDIKYLGTTIILKVQNKHGITIEKEIKIGGLF